MSDQKIPNFILRTGVAFAFIFPAIDAFINPYSWIGYFPKFLKGFVPDLILLHSFGIIEIAIAFTILFSKNIFWPSLIASIMLFGIIIFNTSDFEVLFRDVAILAMTVSLTLSNMQRKSILQ